MRRFTSVLFFLFFVVVFSLNGYYTQAYMVQMRDDTVYLYTLVCIPDTTFPHYNDGPWPVIIERTPYGADTLLQLYQLNVAYLTDTKRYVMVFQDLRGRHNSNGIDSLFREDGWGNLQDGFDTIEWLISQWWCNGKVGMYGESANGIVQYLAGGANPDGLVTAFPKIAAWNQYEFIYPGGEYREYDVDKWVTDYANPNMLPLVKENYLSSDWVWNMDPRTRLDTFDIPMFHIGGWMDCFAPAQIEAYYDLQYNGGTGARGNQKLIIGPWQHTTLGTSVCGEVTFPSNATVNIFTDYEVPWYDYWLKNIQNGIMDIPDVQLYLMGPTDTSGYWNNWLTYDTLWPFAVEDTLHLYLNPDGTMDFTPSDSMDSLSYYFDPRNPVPTVGGQNLFLEAGIYDQDTVWNRNDVLTFVAPYIDTSYDLFGRIYVKLYAKSNRLDTDFTAKLVDICPDGKKMLICDGILMARHRLGFDREDFLDTTQVYEFNIELGYTAYTIVPGHRLGLAISSSNYPRFAVNPNTDQPVNASTDTLIALNKVFMGGIYASEVIIPLRFNIDNYTFVERREDNSPIINLEVVDGYIILHATAEEKNVRVSIFDKIGRVVQDNIIDLFHSTAKIRAPDRSGVYFVRITGSYWDRIEKIVITE